jgi:thymidylate kinase
MNSLGWLVAFEGIDATGKSTLAPIVSDMLQARYGLKSVFVEEFPADYLDGYLGNLMAIDPLLRLHATLPTPVTQTLVLIGAHAYKYETRIAEALKGNDIVCVERYMASVLAYQPVFLEPEMSSTIDVLTAWISAIVEILPPPHINVLLTTETRELAERIRARGEWDEANMRLLEVVARRYRDIVVRSSNWLIFDSSHAKPEQTAQDIAFQIAIRFQQQS